MKILETILIINVVLKFFNLIDWSWSLAFWPFWVELTIIVIIYLKDWLEDY